MIPYRPEAICPATDNFCFVVKAFDGGIVNGQFEITEDVFLMPAYHPGKLSDRIQPGMCRPPEPLLKVLSRPAYGFIKP